MRLECLAAWLAFSLALPVLADSDTGLSFSPQSITFNGTGTQNVKLLPPSQIPPTGLLVNLSSDDPAVAQVQPRTGFFSDGSALSQIPIIAVGPGTTVIHAVARNFTSTTLIVTVIGPAPIVPVPITPVPITPVPVTPPVTVTPTPVTPPIAAILLPSGVTIAPSQQLAFPVTLANPAPPGGVFVTLSSSDISKVTVWPTSAYFSPGQTATDTSVQITGISFGTAAISASAFNFIGDTKTVQVAGGTAAISFSPQSITMFGTGTQNVKLALSAAVPASGLIVNLRSDNPAVAQVQPRAGFFPDGTPISQIGITAVGPGTTVIHAGALPNFPDTTLTVTVIGPGSITLPAGITLAPSQSVAFPVTLSTPASASGAFVALQSSDNTKIIISPETVFIAAGSTTPITEPQVTALTSGSAIISASAPGYQSSSQSVQSQPVQMGGTISFSPTTLTTVMGTNSIQLNLSTPAPPGGLAVNLASNNTGIVTLPATVTLPFNVSSLNIPVTSVGTGSTVIHASAPPNFPDTTAVVNVVNSGTINLPANISVMVGKSVQFPVTLDTPTPTGVIVMLLSSDTSKVSISPAMILIPQGAITPSVQPQLTGVNAGTISISALASGYPTTTQNVQATSVTSSVSVTWYGACWQNYSLYGSPANFQAIDLVLNAPTSVPLQGSLFFAPNCDPSGGIDNMNDTGAPLRYTHTVQFFTHYPDVVPSSAMYWIGDRTADGRCPPGAPCSGCVNYTATTPDCSLLP